MVEALIATEIARGVPASRIVLAGFSQGAAMTLMTGLRHPARLGGLIALSGYLPLAAEVAAERTRRITTCRSSWRTARTIRSCRFARGCSRATCWSKLGYQVDWHAYPMQHTVCAEEVAAIGAFLRRVLDPA